MKILLFLLAFAVSTSATVADEAVSWSHSLGFETSLWDDTDLTCHEGLHSAPALNGPQLFTAAMNCFESDYQLEGAFLLIAGQIRSGTDISLLRPANDIDEVAMSELAVALFYQYGGAGPKELYRNQDKSERLFSKINNFLPDFYDGYNPGWEYRTSSRVHLYETVAEEQQIHRVTQLRHFALLMKDPEYWAAEQELAKIRERNDGVFNFGTADYERSEELRALMSEISQAIEQEALPFGPSVLDEYVPDEDAPFVQVFTGFNGPEEFSRDTYFSEQELRASWIADSLSEKQLDELLNVVDFSSQVVVALASGRRTNATGRFFITDASYNSLLESWTVYGKVGVKEGGCDRSADETYPFGIAVAYAPPRYPITSGGGISNFHDECVDLAVHKPN